jgi:hypothetical protein
MIVGAAPLPNGRGSVPHATKQRGESPPTEPRPSGRGQCFENRHRFTLFVNHILGCSPHRIFRPQRLRTTMAGPAKAIGIIQTASVQCTAAISLHSGHHMFRFTGCRCYSVNMVCTRVGGPQPPVAEGTYLQQTSQHNLPAHGIQSIGSVQHSLARPLLGACICFRQRSTEAVLQPRNRSGLPGQPSTIADPGKQKGAGPSLTVGVLLGRRASHRKNE